MLQCGTSYFLLSCLVVFTMPTIKYAVEWIGVGRSDRPDFEHTKVCQSRY